MFRLDEDLTVNTPAAIASQLSAILQSGFLILPIELDGSGMPIAVTGDNNNAFRLQQGTTSNPLPTDEASVLINWK